VKNEQPPNPVAINKVLDRMIALDRQIASKNAAMKDKIEEIKEIEDLTKSPEPRPPERPPG
jgi:hypothetical protein